MTNDLTKRALPLQPHPDHLRKEAKARLAQLRQRVSGVRLSDVQFTLAREYGFENWAQLMAEVLVRNANARDTRRCIGLALRRFALDMSDHDPEEDMNAAFFRVGVAVQVGFFLAAFAGVGMVFLIGPRMRMVHAAFERLAQLF